MRYNKGIITPRLCELECLDESFDEGAEPSIKPSIEMDEYSFIEVALQRWRDREFRHIDPWRCHISQVQVWT